MLGGPGQPVLELAFGLSARPILVFLACRRIDHPGDMARAGEDELDLSAEETASEEDGFRRRDVIFPGGDVADRNGDVGQRDRVAAHFHASVREIVLQVAVAQVERVVGRAHAGGIGVPIEEIEGQGGLAAHIVGNDVRPDQVARAQHVEGHRHARAFEIALFAHRLFERGDLFLVDEHLQVACMGEIDLGGEEGRGLDAFVAFLRQ